METNKTNISVEVMAAQARQSITALRKCAKRGIPSMSVDRLRLARDLLRGVEGLDPHTACRQRRKARP